MVDRAQSVGWLALREALEASWDIKTSYMGVSQAGNPALGQCYPTSWLVRYFFPEMAIIKGEVATGKGLETHFWNGLQDQGNLYHVDLTWQQFPPGSKVQHYEILDPGTLHDSAATVARCQLLRERVQAYLSN